MLSLAELILEQIADAVIYANGTGTIMQWNHAAAALFGYSAAETLGQNLALITGYVDAYAFVTLDSIFMSFMSKNTTRTSSIIGQGNFVTTIPSTLAIVFFMAKTFARTWLTQSEVRHSHRFLLGAVAVS